MRRSAFVSVREVKTSLGLAKEQESSIFDLQPPSFHFAFFLEEKKNPTSKPPILLRESKLLG